MSKLTYTKQWDRPSAPNQSLQPDQVIPDKTGPSQHQPKHYDDKPRRPSEMIAPTPSNNNPKNNTPKNNNNEPNIPLSKIPMNKLNDFVCAI